MVPTNARISRAAFPAILKSGQRYHGTFVSAVAISSLSPQISVVVSKKVAKSAVDRNRLRRRVYGVAERFIAEASLPATVIFLLKPGALRATRQVIAAETMALLAQITKSR
jgi:ribonuclease P protein component